MKKCCFIIPYFGKLPENFQLFVNTCRENDDFNWLIITDDHTSYDYPDNFQVEYMTFAKVKDLIQRKFDFEISLEKPYKVCDYRPAYGYIFEDYIKDFKCWGHCDCDMLFGKINHFVSDEMLDYYDKLFVLGHCTIYRNTYEINRVFMKPYHGAERYKEVYTDSKSCTFDEEYLPDNINAIFRSYGYKILEDDCSANISFRTPDFRLIRYDKIGKKYITEEKTESIFIYDKGEIKRYFKRFGKLIESEYMYIHFQSRKMENMISNENSKCFKIVANRFIDLEVENVKDDNFSQIKKTYRNHHRREYLVKEIKFWKKRIINKFVR